MVGACLILFFAGIAGALVPQAAERADRRDDPCEAGPQADLCQQKRMADAAWWTVRLTALEILGLLGVVFLTYRSVRTGEESIRLAQRSTEAAEKVLHADRAWMGGVRAWTEPQFREDRFSGLEVHYSWENFGRTPALDVGNYVKLEYPKTTQWPPTFDLSGPRPSSDLVVWPGSAYTFVAVSLPIEVLERAARGEMSIFLYCAVEYLQVYSDERRRSSRIDRLKVSVPHDNLHAPGAFNLIAVVPIDQSAT